MTGVQTCALPISSLPSPSTSCAPSSLGYSCSVALSAIPSVTLHYSYTNSTLSVLAAFPAAGSSVWSSLSFPRDAGAMENADAVIGGIMGGVTAQAYRIAGMDKSSITVDAAQARATHAWTLG